MAKPKKTGHKSHDRIMEQDYQAKQRASTGHNSGLINPVVQGLYEEHEKVTASIRALQKDQKALRVKAKDEFGIATRVFSIELSLRKLDPNVRAEIEQGHQDLKAMLGYQMALNFAEQNAKEGTPDPIAAASRKVTNITKAVLKNSKGKKLVVGQKVQDDDSAA